MIVLFTAQSAYSASPLNMPNDMPLFHYRVQENILPRGEYVFIRSYRQITQILVSKDRNILILYTDRNNMKNSDIFVSSFSRLDSKILREKTISQWEFNFMVETYLENGDSREYSTRKYIGLRHYIDEIKKLGIDMNTIGGKLHLGREFNIEKKDQRGITTSKIFIDPFWKKLAFRNTTDNQGRFNKYYEVYINESYDRNIKRLIRNFSRRLLDMIEENTKKK